METAGLGMASLLALIGTMFMLMCRRFWLNFLDTSAFKEVPALRSEEVFPLLGALVSNFLFIAGAFLFSIGCISLSLLLEADAGFVGLVGVAPFATIFLIMRLTKQSPIGIPFEHLSPPAPAVVVISGSALLLAINAGMGVQDASLNIQPEHLFVLLAAMAVPNLIALRHRRAGWLNQPRAGV